MLALQLTQVLVLQQGLQILKALLLVRLEVKRPDQASRLPTASAQAPLPQPARHSKLEAMSTSHLVSLTLSMMWCTSLRIAAGLSLYEPYVQHDN